MHAIGLALAALVAATLTTASTVTAAGARHQYIVEVGNSANYNAVRAEATGLGASVIRDIRQIRRLVISGTSSQSDSLGSDSRVASVALDHVSTLGPPESTPAAPTGVNVQRATLGAATQSVGSTATGFTLRILPSATPG